MRLVKSVRIFALPVCVSADDRCCAYPGGEAAGGYRNEKNFQNSVIGGCVLFVDKLIFNLL
jgi:hypothetical protein